jgi:hypothetical protein
VSTPHTVSVLLLCVGGLLYALYSQANGAETDTASNLQHGLWAALALGLVFSSEHLRDTLFTRPLPSIWRLVTGMGLFYAMACAFALFQNLEDMQRIFQVLDPHHAAGPHGRGLPEVNYGENCALTWGNVTVRFGRSAWGVWGAGGVCVARCVALGDALRR